MHAGIYLYDTALFSWGRTFPGEWDQPCKEGHGIQVGFDSFEVNLNQLKYTFFKLQDSQRSLEVETPRPGMNVEASPN